MSGPTISRPEIVRRIRSLSLPKVDAVVGIRRGGRIPAAIAASMLECPVGWMTVSFRDDNNRPKGGSPELVDMDEIPCPEGGHILLVDDVSVSGATFRVAIEALGAYRITTLALKGDADYVAFPEFDSCVTWPWSAAGEPVGT